MAKKLLDLRVYIEEGVGAETVGKLNIDTRLEKMVVMKAILQLVEKLE